jgi:thioredoxin 1
MSQKKGLPFDSPFRRNSRSKLNCKYITRFGNKKLITIKLIKMALELTDKNFKETIESTDQLVVVDFWAQWCGPCLMISPIINELSVELEGKVVIGKVDVDTNSDVPLEYKVRNIPTILFIKNGEVIDKSIGAVSKASLLEKIEEYS